VNAQFRSFDEPMLIERHDGSLMMMMRNEKGITESFSADSGYTWTEPVQPEQTNAVARFFLRKLLSGNVLLVRHNNPNNPMERSHLTAFISHDDGKTFQGGLLLDERSGISYPDGFQAPDGKIYIQYDRDRSAGEILSAVFREDEVEIGRILYADSRIQYPIMQGFTKRMIQSK